MKSQINDLVAIRDVESLLEVMEEHDDWLVQLDAAEGLVRLGEQRGLEFLLNALESEYDDMRQVAKEILADPAVARVREEMEAAERRVWVASVEQAKVRLQKGRKVFTYKMVYFLASEILSEETSEEGFSLHSLDKAGLTGWEVVNIIPRRRQVLVNSIDDHFVGVYFLLKKELAPEEIAELDELL